MLSDLSIRIRSLFRRKSAETGLDHELRFHVEEQVEKYVRAGLSRDAARRRVQIDFGGLDQVKEDCRDARGVRWIETFIQDCAYGLRTLAKSPGFTAVALLTLMLGIGANTAIFSVVYGVLLKPLPFRDPGGLIVLHETTPKVGTVSVSYPNFVDWRAQSRTFSEMAVISNFEFNLGGIQEPRTVNGMAVSSNFLPMLGVRPILGRGFTAAEDRAGTAPVVMLSYALWQSLFGGDAGAIGKAVTLDGRRFAVVGVLPPDFRSVDRTDVLEPQGVWATDNPNLNDRGERGNLGALGRLAPRATLESARAEMNGIASRLAKAYPASNDQFGIELTPFSETFTGDLRPAVLVAFGAVTFVLLIACANVANLFLMRGAGRAREISLRIALGATRGRVIRQLLTESLLLAFLGGLLGIGVALGGIRGITKLIPEARMAGAVVNLNGVVVLFAAGTVIFATLLFGVMPAIRLTKADAQEGLKDGGRNSTLSAGKKSWSGALVMAEISLALVLLAGAGLMVRSLHNLLSVDPGFRPERVLTMSIGLPDARYPKEPAILAFWMQLIERVRALPGVESAALATTLPLTDDHSRSDITIEGMPILKPGSYPHPDVHAVAENYLRTMRIRLLSGRDFEARDTAAAPKVALINERLAAQYFPNVDPIGKRFCFGRPSDKGPLKWIEIAGVVRDTKMYGLQNPSRLEVYLPFQQMVNNSMTVTVKSSVEPAAMTAAIREVVRSLDKEQPVTDVATMETVVKNSVMLPRITLTLLGLFSGLALLLAAVGIYGVISYSTAQRAKEIGIRMALGAAQRDVIRMILVQGARIAGIGIAIGMAASFLLTRLLAKLLFAVSAADPLTFAAVTLTLLAVALLACYIPARRTSRVDPMAALRYE